MSLAIFQEQIEEEEPKKETEKKLVGGKAEDSAVIKINRGENLQKEKVIDLLSLKNHLLINHLSGTRRRQARSLE